MGSQVQTLHCNSMGGAMLTLAGNGAFVFPLSQTGSQVALGNNPFWAVCDPSGQFLFVSNSTYAGHIGVAATN
jgi:DNA-binding beta-propeller fold protein YncE